jgi:hypothetical protein
MEFPYSLNNFFQNKYSNISDIPLLKQNIADGCTDKRFYYLLKY